jgi:UDP-glucose/iron transport system permease protein
MENQAGAIILSNFDLVLAGVLVCIAGVISLLFRLELEKSLAVAALRTVIQLTLVGFILKWVFALEYAVAVIALGLIMTFLASRASVARSSRTFSGIRARAFFSLFVSGFITTAMVTGVIVGVDPWYKPQYVIPLLGMILGNGLNGLSLCMDTLLENLSEKRHEVELDLAMGATRWEAARPALAEGVRRGMMPIINSMTVVGMVSLPGMMTGQILQGADPVNAIKYQVMVMFMIAAAVSVSSIILALLIYKRLFNSKHQLNSDLIKEKSS